RRRTCFDRSCRQWSSNGDRGPGFGDRGGSRDRGMQSVSGNPEPPLGSPIGPPGKLHAPGQQPPSSWNGQCGGCATALGFVVKRKAGKGKGGRGDTQAYLLHV